MYKGQERIRSEVERLKNVFPSQESEIIFRLSNRPRLVALAREDASLRESLESMLKLVREAVTGLGDVKVGRVPLDMRTRDVLNFFFTAIRQRCLLPGIESPERLEKFFEAMERSLDWLLRGRLNNETVEEAKKTAEEIRATVEFWTKILGSRGESAPLFSDNFLAVRSF